MKPLLPVLLGLLLAPGSGVPSPFAPSSDVRQGNASIPQLGISNIHNPTRADLRRVEKVVGWGRMEVRRCLGHPKVIVKEFGNEMWYYSWGGREVAVEFNPKGFARRVYTEEERSTGVTRPPEVQF